MRIISTILIAGSLLAACGPKAIALPADPIDRAATCGVVAAASARKGVGVDAKLTLEQQASILHYSLLAASEGGSFDHDKAAAVVARMPALEAKVTGNKWAELEAPCREAYPATGAAAPVSMPKDPLQAQLGCDALADFLTTALRQREADFIDDIRKYDDLERTLDAKMGVGQKARGMDMADAQRARSAALGKLVTLGPPTTVMETCLKRFGTPTAE